MSAPALHPIEEQAAAWDARLRSPDASDADRSAFRAWLQAEPAHAEAFDRLQAALAALRDHAGHPELSALRDQGRATVQRAAARRARGRLAAGLLAAGFAAVAVIAGVQLAGRRPSPPSPTPAAVAEGGKLYQTALDERSTVSLQDGSSVTLDSGTRLAARFLPGRREIRLIAGQALFHVAKDPGRPFVVRAGDRTVTALGTVFSVRLDKGRMRVALIEGRVAVRPLAGAAPATLLQPRQELAELGPGAPVVRPVDVDKAVSWTEGRIYLDDEPLAQAVEEMNRYAAHRIVLADPALAGLRVNGMFRTDNQTGFVAALQATLPIEARTDDQGRVLLQRRGA